MGKTSFKLNIKTPCSQDWLAMEEQELGRFCKACSKTVVDFTNMSDAELVKFMKESKGKICGRMHQDQLNRKYKVINNPATGLGISKLVAGLLLLMPGSVAVASNVSHPTFELADHTVHERTILDTVPKQITGKIIDTYTKNVIPHAAIVLKNMAASVVTDKAGDFKMTIPDMPYEQITIEVSAVGYETQTFFLQKNEVAGKEFLLTPIDNILLGDVVIVGAISTKKWWQFWKWF